MPHPSNAHPANARPANTQPSNTKRPALYADLTRAVRLSIAGSSLYSQRVAEKLGLHPTDLQFLNLLDLLGPLTPKVLGHYSGLTSGGVSVVLNRLEKAGYIRRLANPKDGRSVVVDFAPAKRRKVKAHYARVEQQFTDLMIASPIEELETVLAFFTRMNAARASRA
jgi:MarR family transcriptional regulator, organic hydroperoxide resistance regulator